MTMLDAPISERTSPALNLKSVHASHGQVSVLHGVSFSVGLGESVALLGRNGMGKTTTLQCILGTVPISAGSISVLGSRADGYQPHEIVGRGLGYVPENRGIFHRLTISENLDVSRIPGSRWTRDRLIELFPDLRGRFGERAGNLSGGQQQMVAMGRALSSDPSLLILDEPTAGLAPLVIRKIADALREIQAAGVTLFVVEQSLAIASHIAERMIFMEGGRIVGELTRAEIESEPGLLDKYLSVGY